MDPAIPLFNSKRGKEERERTRGKTRRKKTKHGPSLHLRVPKGPSESSGSPRDTPHVSVG